MRKLVIFLISIFCFVGNIHAYIFGSVRPIPYKSYMYHNEEPVGFTRGSHVETWKVTNGKIMDDEGNFTLTTKTIVNGDRHIYVQWDGTANIEMEGKLEYTYSRDWYHIERQLDVFIKPTNLIIEDMTIDSSVVFEYPHIFLRNVDLQNGCSVNINGFRSVTLLLGFVARIGSNVRIYNEQPPLPNETEGPYYQSRKATGTENILYDKSIILNQNVPNPVLNSTSISYCIPESMTSSYIQVNDMLGNLILKIPLSIEVNEVTIQKGELSQGMYIYSLIVDGKFIDSKRMIINL